MFKGLPGLAWLRGLTSPLGGSLGPLEREVMEVVWRSTELSVRDVQAQLPRSAAYTTVMTTLDRLYKKGLVRRRRVGRAFLYTASFRQDEIDARLTAGVLSGALERGAAPGQLLSNLVDAVGDRDDRLLDELEQLVREKRRRMKRGQP